MGIVVDGKKQFFYKLRRKMQSVAFSIIPHGTLSKLYYRIYLHERLNLEHPQSLNEKLQWYKLYYCPNTAGLVNELVAAQQYRLSKMEKQWLVPDLVVIDEFGFLRYSKNIIKLQFGLLLNAYI